MLFTIEITDPVHCDFLKDAQAKIVTINNEAGTKSSIFHLEHWGVEELSNNISKVIVNIMEKE